jgi:3-oxoacyl-[acyl-carrier protein] reductase
MIRALVTGGASPLGAAICRRLAADGMHVLVHAHAGLDRAEALAAEIRAGGGGAEAFASDIADMDATEAAMQRLVAEGAPQVVVHNAGAHDDVPMAGMSRQQWQRPIDVSLNGFFAVVQPLLLPMMATRWGRVVAVSSVTALLGNRGQVNYAAAKAGLIGAVKSLAREVATRGITVNAVAPGVIASPAVDAVMDRARIAEIVPMRRAGTPEEVADLIGFLASRQSGYITGQTISINGGMA